MVGVIPSYAILPVIPVEGSRGLACTATMDWPTVAASASWSERIASEVLVSVMESAVECFVRSKHAAIPGAPTIGRLARIRDLSYPRSRRNL
jgi:hypothetical protein